MSGLNQLSDEESLELIANDDALAFRELHYRYWEQLFVHAIRMLRDEDVIQEVFLRLWEKAAHMKCTTNFLGYIYMTARNRVLNAIRKRTTEDHFIQELACYSFQHDGGA
ncbi:RNA polymerase sigma factor [Olivibacter sitiensis]|uniref:RNA polymerase sigma factor n=1 Tax=Olivibacter sitiensis TaxID=376470 RepID=UPI0003F513D2|nr:sigma-70 family RNA polymerase sigma factor [Olivibacter sitiensis]